MGCAHTNPRPPYIVDPAGHCLTEYDLPHPGTHHWTGEQKALVVAAVEGGLISRHEACRRYAMSVEEYLTWKDIMQRFGVEGLLASHAQTVWNSTPH